MSGVSEIMRALRAGEVVDFEGVPVRAAADQSLVPGVTYIAGRNSGPHLLTVERVVVEDNWGGGFVVPVELAYSFDIPECVVVDVLIDATSP